MDEELIQKIILGCCVVIVIFSFMTLTTMKLTTQTLDKKLQCKQIIDDIYQSCREGSQTNISDIKGGSTTLKYENGVCIIK